MKNKTAIKAVGLSKKYKRLTPGEKHNTLIDAISSGLKSPFSTLKSSRENDFWALKNVSFEIETGENVGIIGLNGAGKSTLLKVLSRITAPTEGWADLNGRVGSLLEVGTGFHWELTGRENVYLYGAILGMTKKEIEKKFDAIVEFSEIKDFLDTPVKRYSSGMYVRLAFAVAAHLDPDILMVDEVLSVGDLPFQQKCMNFAKGLKKGQGTILFVSHNMFSIKTMCKRSIYIQNGHIQFDGPTDQAIKLYEKNCRLAHLGFAEVSGADAPIRFKDIRLLDDTNHEKNVFKHGERMKIRIRYEATATIERPNVIIAFIRSDGVACCNYSTETDGSPIETIDGEGAIELLTPPMTLIAEMYTIHILVREKGFSKVVCAQIGATFHIQHEIYDRHFGVFREAGTWRIGD